MRVETTYSDILQGSAAENGSIACMGIDPVLEALPLPELSPRRRVLLFFEPIFEKMKSDSVLPGAFKPNLGFFHCLDRPFEGEEKNKYTTRGSFEGSEALLGILQLLREYFPDTPVILDMKRGDIARSSRNYAEEAFVAWQGDAVTISPYMGADSAGPFIELAAGQGGGVYILNRTSNPGAAELQNLKLEDGRPLYRHVADRIAAWGAGAPAGTVGAVVGATSLQELGELAAFFAEVQVPLLIPGVGGQGGSASDTVRILREAGYPLGLARINSSSGLTHPWLKKGDPLPDDWPSVVVEKLRSLNNELGYA
jgi:orotidine-5'-phosphate decarboxylase